MSYRDADPPIRLGTVILIIIVIAIVVFFTLGCTRKEPPQNTTIALPLLEYNPETKQECKDDWRTCRAILEEFKIMLSECHAKNE